MAQFSFRVEDEVGEAFKIFCEDHDIRPYQLLETIVSYYGRAQLINKKFKEGRLTKEEAFVELGRIMGDAKQFAKANGKFCEAMDRLLKPYGLDTKAFGFR